MAFAAFFFRSCKHDGWPIVGLLWNMDQLMNFNKNLAYHQWTQSTEWFINQLLHCCDTKGLERLPGLFPANVSLRTWIFSVPFHFCFLHIPLPVQWNVLDLPSIHDVSVLGTDDVAACLGTKCRWPGWAWALTHMLRAQQPHFELRALGAGDTLPQRAQKLEAPCPGLYCGLHTEQWLRAQV